ncbi:MULTISPECIES: hypothetical protein [unclassified Pseudoalteromonas]|nr:MULTISPECIES: hypothetical protein [unclassified Pseudoalteromonas]MDN3380314.1 hypothetical protein [Pseudoalteromonas sp. APC 3893]MDN3388754.1 hypothetical protein [Pseudoalteromonas sp. APC 4017]
MTYSKATIVFAKLIAEIGDEAILKSRSVLTTAALGIDTGRWGLEFVADT